MKKGLFTEAVKKERIRKIIELEKQRIDSNSKKKQKDNDKKNEKKRQIIDLNKFQLYRIGATNCMVVST